MHLGVDDMRDTVLAYCKRKQQEAIAAQDWASAQDYQDMHSMWKKRFDEAEAKQAIAA
tara:strand:+ start:581 stop:754 length:174 start_codon:yes stop_codon:yes gene_type:complete